LKSNFIGKTNFASFNLPGPYKINTDLRVIGAGNTGESRRRRRTRRRGRGPRRRRRRPRKW